MRLHTTTCFEDPCQACKEQIATLRASLAAAEKRAGEMERLLVEVQRSRDDHVESALLYAAQRNEEKARADKMEVALRECIEKEYYDGQMNCARAALAQPAARDEYRRGLDAAWEEASDHRRGYVTDTYAWTVCDEICKRIRALSPKEGP